MPSYNHCVRLGLSMYEMSSLDSSRCIEYVRKNRSGYNILDVSSKQLLAISAQHLRVEVELEKAEERVARLCKQKKMQREKLTRTISRGIFDVEELEKVETEKTVRVGISGSEMLLIHLFSNTGELLIPFVD